MAKSKKLDKNLTNAVLYLLVGVLFCLFRSSVLGWLLTAVGVLFIVQGVLSLLQKDMAGGIVGLVIGLLVILGGWLFVEIVMVLFGVLVIVKGVTSLMDALKRKNNTMPILMAGVTLFVGILLIVSRWAMLDWFFVILGVIFIINGVLALLGSLR